MKLFDELIAKTIEQLASYPQTLYRYAPEHAAKEGELGQLILRKDMAFELGEGSYPSVSLTAITQDEALVEEDGILVCGPELSGIKGDCAFARVTLIRTDDVYENGDQAAYNLIKSLETQKFLVSPEGYMMRPSGMTNREQVRVSKKAVKAGLSFAAVGSLLIQKYHTNPHVKAVRMIFVTLPEAPYRELDTLADKVGMLTKTLNHALADVSMDCHVCEWKPVCDSVEGMKELHQKRAGL